MVVVVVGSEKGRCISVGLGVFVALSHAINTTVIHQEFLRLDFNSKFVSNLALISPQKNNQKTRCRYGRASFSKRSHALGHRLRVVVCVCVCVLARAK